MNFNFRILKKVSVMIVLCLLYTREYGYSIQQDFYEAAKEINKQHVIETMCVPNVNIKDYTPALKAREVGFTTVELDSMMDYGKYKAATSHLTYEQAAGDVNLAFRFYKNCYGAYFYFGGDKAFEKAKKKVLADCKLAGENLTVGILREALKKNLSFVKDGHFWIDGDTVFTKAVYYSNEEAIFKKDEKGYYMEQDGQRSYVSLVDGSSAVEKFMKRSINDEGMLVYRLGMLSAEEKKTAEVVFDDRAERFTVLPPKLENINGNTYNSGYVANNIPLVAIRSFMDEQAGQQFVRSAVTIKNSNVSILDLRGNSGGMSQYVTDWLDIYDPVLSKYAGGKAFTSRWSRAADYIWNRRLELYPAKHEAEKILSNSRIKTNYWETGMTSAYERSKNNSLLFVLVDSRTFSASEWLIAALRNKDNVIFVGTNTGGGLMSDSAIKVMLPGSRINVQCGFSLRFYYNETVFSEETGFLPDIWTSTDVMEQILNMISFYELSGEKSETFLKKYNYAYGEY